MLEEFNKTLQIAEGLNEQEVEMTPQLVVDILNVVTYPDIELEEDETLTVDEYTVYNTYKIYGTTYQDLKVMLEGDYLNILQELSEKFVTTLPDDFEKFFDSKALYNAELDDRSDYFSSQIIATLNKNGYDLYNIIRKESVELNGVNYVIVKLS